MDDTIILAGDVGGTKTRLALFCGGLLADTSPPECLATQTFPSSQYLSLHEIAQAFLGEHRRPVAAACFGVAGPVKAGRCETVNLSWVVDEGELSRSLGIGKVRVINDLVANALGIAALGPDDVVVIQPGEPGAVGNGAVISPGTGLGEAGLFWDGRRMQPFASEGGHSDFAPRNKLEFELGEYLDKRFKHVSYERVLSGPGLVSIFEFLRDTGRGAAPPWLVEEMQTGDGAACISRAAMAGKCKLCEKTLDVFIEVFGAEAGNLALKMMATGGVWLGGGITAKIIDRLRSSPGFLRGFTSKGRLSHLVEHIPVRAILNQDTALLGAAMQAREIVGGE